MLVVGRIPTEDVMTGNRVVVHKRNQNPSPIDQLGTTIPMAELFAPPLPF
jgi:hypothetical protein